MFRTMSRAQQLVDVLLGVLWLLFGLLFIRSDTGSTPVLVLVIVALSAALALRRRSPALSLAIAWCAALVQVVFTPEPAPVDAAIFAILYATASWGGRVVRWLGLASAVVGAGVIALNQLLRFQPATESSTYLFGVPMPAGAAPALIVFITFLFGFLLSWTLGLLARTWRLSREASRAELAAQREVVVQQERNRIARDLHDVVAHSLAVVVAQADGARYAKGVAVKDGALATISGTAREALGDVRLLLARLRHEEAAEPQPGLGDLDALVEQVRASGLDVGLEHSGEPLALPPGQQLALYRIVQEALTNALRHGDADRPVVVSLEWRPDQVTVQVRNAVRGPAGAEGHGLPGMRERAALAGGALTAAADGGDWVVRASIPVAA